VLGYLGLARRAGKLSIGHDAAMLSVRRGTAHLVLLTEDASPRHLRELEAAGFSDRTAVIPHNMNDTGVATGKKSCIYALDDEGFAKAILNTLSKEGK
jgi:ribosomal protein L7Ae-like RNA K-turn-binding protein